MVASKAPRAVSVRHRLRWGSSLVAFLLGCLFLYWAAFQSWLSWGPPTLDPTWHRTWSYRLAAIALASFVAAGVLPVVLRPREQFRRTPDEPKPPVE